MSYKEGREVSDQGLTINGEDHVTPHRWVIYNDNKVALSVEPPVQLGYLYLYKRLINNNL